MLQVTAHRQRIGDSTFLRLIVGQALRLPPLRQPPRWVSPQDRNLPQGETADLRDRDVRSALSAGSTWNSLSILRTDLACSAFVPLPLPAPTRRHRRRDPFNLFLYDAKIGRSIFRVVIGCIATTANLIFKDQLSVNSHDLHKS